jgi:hypothetical protein
MSRACCTTLGAEAMTRGAPCPPARSSLGFIVLHPIEVYAVELVRVLLRLAIVRFVQPEPQDQQPVNQAQPNRKTGSMWRSRSAARAAGVQNLVTGETSSNNPAFKLLHGV